MKEKFEDYYKLQVKQINEKLEQDRKQFLDTIAEKAKMIKEKIEVYKKIQIKQSKDNFKIKQSTELTPLLTQFVLMLLKLCFHF